MSRILLVEPEKSRKYHTPYPPLGLLKLAAYHKRKKDKVRYKRMWNSECGIKKNSAIRIPQSAFSEDGFTPDVIYITSLFTYAYEPVHEAIRYCLDKYKKTRIVVGGIYATLCPDHLKETFKCSTFNVKCSMLNLETLNLEPRTLNIYQGLVPEAEELLPDYSLVPEWNASIIFSTRGCIRRCSFCSVPEIEPEFKANRTIRHLIYPGHKKVIFWDNNILASPYWSDIFDEIEEVGAQNFVPLQVDFNQGLDARLLTDDVAQRLRRLKIPILRLAYDSKEIGKSLHKAISLLKDVGIRGRKIVIYCLYNHRDTPEDFLNRIKDLLEWGVVAYPMRYEPLAPAPKNTHISPNWTKEQLEMIADARRVIGYGGAFPPYEGLKKKILPAKDFEEAFKLRPPNKELKGSRVERLKARETDGFSAPI